ncbi:hypothetical protein [Roseomonas chloroacetimidivorans]|uniref:hypothetical protein n=1 Tax=Roseomonas chloroacetimidivorans TaxID=1766656 RepID=UPI003C7964CB
MILGFAPLVDGACPSRHRVLALLREVMPAGSHEPVMLAPPSGGWVTALHEARSPGRRAA